MGTVTGYTADYMDQISNNVIISGAVDSTGHLILTKRNGSTLDAGYVMGPQGIPGAGTASLATAYQLLSPVGTVSPFAGTVIPSGWLECNGQSISRTTYNNLWAAFGSQALYGAFDGSTFNVPDLRGKVIIGHSAWSSGFASNMGFPQGTGGSADAIVVTHNHPHNHGGTTANQTLSNHKIAGDSGERIWVTATGTQNNSVPGWSTASGYVGAVPSHVDAHDPHNHTIPSDTTLAGASGTNANLPPYQILKYIIRF